MKVFTQHTIQIFLICLLLSACNLTQDLKDNELLLRKNTIQIDSIKSSSTDIASYLIQRPNNNLLGKPIGLYLYNIGNPKYDSIHKKQLDSQNNKILNKILSQKQTNKLIDKKRKINNWFLTNGEPPVVLNSKKTSLSAENLRTHFFNNGYFNNKVSTKVLSDTKQAHVTYNITKGLPFQIGKISYRVESNTIDSILKKKSTYFSLKEGDQYNLSNFTKTLEQITSYLRNNGFYHFSEGLVSFRKIDTLASNQITPVEIHIKNRKLKKDGEIIEAPTEIQTIKKVSIFTDYSYNNRNKAYTTKKRFNLIDFYAHKKLKYKIKNLSNSIFIEPKQTYSDKNIELTRKHLKSLNNFKSIRINHRELPNNKLAANIILTPQKKYGFILNTEIIHSNIKQLGLSGGFSFINRNIFKGAEIFKLSLQGSIFDTATDSDGSNSTNFNAHEIGIDGSLVFPKFIFPFLENLIPRTMTPKTTVSIGTSFQKNIGLDKQRITGVIDYNWKSSKKNSHTFELLNLQYVNNLNPESYYSVYSSEFNQISEIKTEYNLLSDLELTTDNANYFLQNLPDSFANTNENEYTTLKNIEKREEILTTNNIIPTSSYSFEHNSRRGLSDTSYNFFKTKISSSGNLSTLFAQKQNGQPIFENIEISQFIKLDIDFRKFWSINTNNSIAFRAFGGVAIPTGVTKEIPFTSSYFAGGSNDIRAWKTYELGPGSSNSGLEFNIGNLKLLSSIEYRFKVINSIHGAIFADAGNIWSLPNTTAATEKETFSHLKSLENIAIGSGIGLRYDFNFLVFRLDWAFKTFEPYLNEDKWFSNYDVSSSVLNIGINYPF